MANEVNTIEWLVAQFIKTLRERAYGPGNWSNELEGDYGTWDEWELALIEFGYRVQKLPPNKPVEPTGQPQQK